MVNAIKLNLEFPTIYENEKLLDLVDKRVDGVLGIRTLGGSMEGADESTEPWRHPKKYSFLLIIAYMVCSGFEPWEAVWKAQTNPLSYGGTPKKLFYL